MERSSFDLDSMTAFTMDDEPHDFVNPKRDLTLGTSNRSWVDCVTLFIIVALIATVTKLGLQPTIAPSEFKLDRQCDTVGQGYMCNASISHFWGQYSMYFSVPSDISATVPKGCHVNQVSILSRHGGRDPTATKTLFYNATIQKIKGSVSDYPKEFKFLKHYAFALGADQLTEAGRQEMINSGAKFSERYHDLENARVFIRTTDSQRVLDSANLWLDGLLHKNSKDYIDVKQYGMLIIPEGEGINNTLSNKLCKPFRYGPSPSDEATKTWLDIFGSPLQERLSKKLPGSNLSLIETFWLMDMCPFETVAHPKGEISPFCSVFTEEEWKQYDYYYSLAKYYQFSGGNRLASTQGIGYANELIARLTGTPVDDHTSTNTTLDSNGETFPLDWNVFADFSHDNDMLTIFTALGLYNTTAPLSNNTMQNTNETNGFSASLVVPFAARAYFERLSCPWEKEEYVRVIVNDRVLPLEHCGGDSLGRCTVRAFVDSLSFAKSGGYWDECFP